MGKFYVKRYLLTPRCEVRTGMRTFPLKEGAEPERLKPFYQHGERFAAMKKSPMIAFRKSSSKTHRCSCVALPSPKIRGGLWSEML